MTLFGYLASTGESMSEKDLVHYVLEELELRYFSFVSNMNMREVQLFIYCA